MKNFNFYYKIKSVYLFFDNYFMLCGMSSLVPVTGFFLFFWLENVDIQKLTDAFTSVIFVYGVFLSILPLRFCLKLLLRHGLKDFVKSNETEFSSYQKAKQAFEHELWKTQVVALNEKDARKLQRLKK